MIISLELVSFIRPSSVSTVMLSTLPFVKPPQ